MTKIKKIYQEGKKLRAQSNNESYHECLTRIIRQDEFYPYEDEAGMIHQAGYEGRSIYKVTGWRYGDMPKKGFSRNYRKGRSEPGISMMEITLGTAICGNNDRKGEIINTCDYIAAMTLIDRKRVELAGYWIDGSFGGDGEPCIFLMN